MVVKIAARQSDLARLQAFEVGRALEKVSPDLEIEYSFRSSLGDQRADDPLWKMPEKGVFTEDFVHDILSGKVDLVVHSWKDLPILDRTGTKIVATLARADARDVLLVRRDRWNEIWATPASRSDGATMHPEKFRILTSSPRRVYNLEPFLKWALPWGGGAGGEAPMLEFVPVRGNIATRVSKLVQPAFADAADAFVVSKAALDRLLTSAKYGAPFDQSEKDLRGWLSQVDLVVLPLSVNPAAAAQGALAIEVRADRNDLIELCAKIDSFDDRLCVEAERRELARHGGGCHQKIGVTMLNRPYGRIEFIKGLTDAGLTLDSIHIRPKTVTEWPRAKTPDEVFLGEMKSLNRRTLKVSLNDVNLLGLNDAKSTRARGFFVARANAWPEDQSKPEGAYVWTAGLQTWRQLAARGIWVHGTSEGLGEDEGARLDVIAGREIAWVRLTHAGAGTGLREEAVLATYQVEIEPPPADRLEKARFFYWKSGSQFRAALSRCPAILNGYHASGPGHTHKAILEEFARRGAKSNDVDARVAVVLNEAEFSKKVLG